MSDLGILADDLTGACDAAASFALRVGPVRVFLDPRRGRAPRETVLAVLNTQSRLLSPRRSRLRVRRVARSLRGRPVIYKKTDSVLRGPAGAELQALAGLFAGYSVFVIPAIPEMGKTTRDGLLFEHGIPAHQTEYRKDPLSPLLTNDIRRIIGATGQVDFETADAETMEDIARAVDQALARRGVILAGSLGLADELACRLQPADGPAGHPPPAAREGSAASAPGRTLILSGSSYPVAHAQLGFAAAAFGEEVLRVSTDRDVSEVLPRCQGKQFVFLQIDTGEMHKRGETRWRLSALFRQVGRIIHSYGPDAVGVVGGETAYRILRLLRTTRLEVEGRGQPGLPYGVIEDGELQGCAFSTKGGSVGTPDACVRMVTCMTHRGKDAS